MIVCNSNNHVSIVHSNTIACPLCISIEENEYLKEQIEKLKKPRIKL